MLVKFRQHTVKMTGSYKCECGKRFKRNVSDYWTENPFNTTFKEGGAEASDARSLEILVEKLREVVCPKCGKMCENLDL